MMRTKEAIMSTALLSLTACASSPGHHASDVMLTPGGTAIIEAKFAYGTTSKDLEGATVLATVRLDDAWYPLGSATTDDDGRASVEIPSGLLEFEGIYEVQWLVEEDGTTATSYAYVAAPGQKTVVFDIDGTLTMDDLELVEGSGADIYEGAADVVSYWQSLGYQPVFITARPYLFETMTRDWLTAHGLDGPVFLKPGFTDDTKEYKRDLVLALKNEAKLDVEFAYGNAETDICAYAEAGIAPERTFIIGENAGKACTGFAPTTAVSDYPTHLEQLEK